MIRAASVVTLIAVLSIGSRASGDDLGAALAEIRSFEAGLPREPLSVVSRLVRAGSGDPETRRAVADQLADALAESSVDCQVFLCEQLSIVGDEGHVEPIGQLLSDPRTAHAARTALERIGGAGARSALRTALQQGGPVRLGVINSIGRLEDAQSVDVLLELYTDANSDERRAIIGALGQIGALDAVLQIVAESGEIDVAPELIGALFHIADRLEREGDFDLAMEAHSRISILIRNLPPAQARRASIGAFSAVARLRGAEAIPQVVELLSSDDDVARGVASELVRTMEGTDITPALVSALDGMDSGQAPLIEALGRRADPAASEAVTRALVDPDPMTQLAAVGALGRLADTRAILPLVHLASTSGPMQQPARDALASAPTPGFDQGLADALNAVGVGPRSEIVAALAARRAFGQAPAVAALMHDGNMTVRVASIHALASLGSGDQLSGLIDRLVSAESVEERTAAEHAIVAVVDRTNATNLAGQALADSMSGADLETRRAVLRVMSAVGGDASLTAVRRALGRPELHVDAVNALADWPTSQPAEDLLALASVANDPGARSLAFNGYVRLVGLHDSAKVAEKVGMYRDALELAANATERRAVLEGFATVPSPESLQLVRPLIRDPLAGKAAAMTAVRIASEIRTDDKSLAIDVLKEVAALSDPEARRAAADAVSAIEAEDDFITDWVVSGPHMKDGISGNQALNAAFLPEPAFNSVSGWRDLPGNAISGHGMINLSTIGEGSDRCAYLRTQIRSEGEHAARLEIGSDDGVKVWLNGEVVHVNNAARGHTYRQDVVPVTIPRGTSTLVVKVSQGGGDWAMSCRIRSEDGFHLEGVMATSR